MCVCHVLLKSYLLTYLLTVCKAKTKTTACKTKTKTDFLVSDRSCQDRQSQTTSLLNKAVNNAKFGTRIILGVALCERKQTDKKAGRPSYTDCVGYRVETSCRCLLHSVQFTNYNILYQIPRNHNRNFLTSWGSGLKTHSLGGACSGHTGSELQLHVLYPLTFSGGKNIL